MQKAEMEDAIAETTQTQWPAICGLPALPSHARQILPTCCAPTRRQRPKLVTCRIENSPMFQGRKKISVLISDPGSNDARCLPAAGWHPIPVKQAGSLVRASRRLVPPQVFLLRQEISCILVVSTSSCRVMEEVSDRPVGRKQMHVQGGMMQHTGDTASFHLPLCGERPIPWAAQDLAVVHARSRSPIQVPFLLLSAPKLQ
jgi:hypothetical protein